MPVTQGLKDHLAGNVVFVCPIWKITSRDGLVAAYCSHSRPGVGNSWNPLTPFTFNGVNYAPAPVTNTRDLHRIGLRPNSTEITGAFDNLITRVDVEIGRWKLATVDYEYVCYLDLSLGSMGKISGVVGQINPKGPLYEMEFLSNAHLLDQQIGDLTSPTDRNAFPAGVNKATWTVSRNVVSSTNRRNLVIDGVAKPNSYFKHGVLTVTTGAAANQRSAGMEIKDNVGNAIELQLPMPSDFVAGNVVSLVAGYQGTREEARDRFGAMIDSDSEPDVPGMKQLLSYPG